MEPRICVSIVDKDSPAIREVSPLVTMFEVRLDLIGEGWADVARQLTKPWIACLRNRDEGGHWEGEPARKLDELLTAARLGADIVDIELKTANLEKAVTHIKQQAQCLLSFHDTEKTPPLAELKEIIKRQLDAGADICKVVTTARSFGDNLTTLKLIGEFPEAKIISFAMGEPGTVSRIISPLAGGYLTYASVETGAESAPGQITAGELLQIYEMVAK